MLTARAETLRCRKQKRHSSSSKQQQQCPFTDEINQLPFSDTAAAAISNNKVQQHIESTSIRRRLASSEPRLPSNRSHFSASRWRGQATMMAQEISSGSGQKRRQKRMMAQRTLETSHRVSLTGLKLCAASAHAHEV